MASTIRESQQLSRFTVQRQVDHGRQILEALVDEEARVHEFASELVRRMLPGRITSSRSVALLPDLLKLCESGPKWGQTSVRAE